MNAGSKSVKVGSDRYIKELFRRWLGGHWWIFAMVMGLCITLALTVNTAFLFVGAIMMFIVFPFALSFVYFHYGFKPEARVWSCIHEIYINDDYIAICYKSIEKDVLKEIGCRTIKIGDIKNVFMAKSCIIVDYGDRRDDFVIIPDQAFDDKGQKGLFHERVYDTIRRNSLNLQS